MFQDEVSKFNFKIKLQDEVSRWSFKMTFQNEVSIFKSRSNQRTKGFSVRSSST